MAILLYNNVKEKVMNEDNFALLYIIKIHIYAHTCGYDIEGLDKSSEF